MSGATPRVTLAGGFEAQLNQLPLRIGQVIVRRAAAGDFELRHRDDDEDTSDALKRYTGAAAAGEIALYDEVGNYRPLKTAPNLRRGWLLLLADGDAVRKAIESFYPGRTAAFNAWTRAELVSTPFRETLARQSGMYRVAAKITDEGADQLIGNLCRSDGGCLRTILWKRDKTSSNPSTLLPVEKFDPAFDQTGRGQHVLPLLCQEACNLLVAAAREVVKANEPD